MEDRQIIDGLFERSDSALTELSAKYDRLCKSIANNILNNASDAEECVNDAYLGVWNSIPPNRPDSLQAYLLKIVRNLSLKRYRFNTAQKRNSHFDASLEELESCVASEESVERKIELAELTEAVNRFLAGLKETDRVIFMRRYYFSDSYERIAQITGLSEKNVSVRLARIRSRLRGHLAEEKYL